MTNSVLAGAKASANIFSEGTRSFFEYRTPPDFRSVQ